MTIANTTGYYVNGDTLLVKYPQAEVVLGTSGSYTSTLGSQFVSEWTVDYNSFSGATGATVVNILDYDNVLPDGALISSITFITGAAWDSTSSDVTLNFGLVKRSDFTTIVDADGLVDSLAKSVIDTPNAQVAISNEANSTYAGALIDDDGGLVYDSVVCCFWENHAPSAGTGRLRILWSR